MKIKEILLSLIAVVVIVSCGKGNINKMSGITVIEKPNEAGLIVFMDRNGLVGVADSNGDVILDPDFGEVSIHGNFIVAHLSEAKYEEELKKIAEKSGINENTRPGDDIKPVSHEFIRIGYNNLYYRLYNSKGKMLKDYCLNPFYGINKTMRDSLIWKSNNNADPKRNVKQIVDVNGNTTDIDDYCFGGGCLFYIEDDNTYVRYPDGKINKISGWQPKVHNNLILTRGIASDLKLNCLTIYKPDGNSVYIEGWTPCGWMNVPDGDGIFVLAMEGGLYDERSAYVRPRTVFYVTEEGNVADLPIGYYLKKDPYYPKYNLYNSLGHEIYGWK